MAMIRSSWSVADSDAVTKDDYDNIKDDWLSDNVHLDRAIDAVHDC